MIRSIASACIAISFMKVAMTDNKEPCANPTCHSVAEMMNLARSKSKIQKKNKTAELQNPYKDGCPVDKELLGKSTWNLIHSVAASFPENPTEEEKKNVSDFFISLSKVYPCPHCRDDFRQSVEIIPPE